MGSGRLKVEFMNHHVNHHIKGQRTTPCFAVKDCKAVRNPLLPWLKKHATKATLHVTYDGCIVGECFTDILMNDKAT